MEKNTWRIYLEGRGLGHYRPLLNWCKQAVEDGRLPRRIDRNGQQYILVNDLLPYKGQLVGTCSANSSRLDLPAFLADGVIAFGEVKKLMVRIYAENPDIEKKLAPYAGGNLGYVALYADISKYIIDVGLGDWIS